ncbi:MAG: Ppx/GppA family phosphatase [Ignavibacteriae bacterium]|nr:Ppx/GppA family phosphatase [Ignavibacteriota bacterium]
MRIATIDIGTNTILLLVADVDARGGLTVVTDEQAIARLGKGVDAERRIQPDTFRRCETILRAHAETCRYLACDHIVATGTSALRDAANRDEFIAAMKQATGFGIELLSGEAEALWTWTGAVSGIGTHASCAVLDIGGGSTELAVGSRGGDLIHGSVDVGAVRLTEKFLHSAPPRDEELHAAEAAAREALAGLPHIDGARSAIVAVAGTVTTLAAIELGLRTFDRKAVAGHQLTLAAVERLFEQMSKLGKDALHTELSVDPGRADIIVAGILILRTFMRERGVESLTVSERGLRYGIALREASRALTA